MKERPILFSGPMVRAILEDRKTKTRRIIKPDKRFHSRGYYPGDRWHFAKHPEGGWWGHDGDPIRATPILGKGGGFLCPYGVPGDRLWVREAFCQPYRDTKETINFGPCPTLRSHKILYRADDGKEWFTVGGNYTQYNSEFRWHPSIHMPRWASRINLEVLSVKVECVQDITEEDAIAEGIGHGFQMNAGWPDYQHIKNGVCELTQDSAKMSFASLWDSINGKPRKDGVDISWNANPWVFVIEFQRLASG